MNRERTQLRCDVCDVPLSRGEGELITAEAFRYLLNNGFGILEEYIQELVSDGIPREEAVRMLRAMYAQYESDWLLCPKCAAEANALVVSLKHAWIDADHIEVTRTAEDAGFGYYEVGAPVALTRRVWNTCVEWTETDNKKQCYQEQDARLWDVVAVGGATLKIRFDEFVRSQKHLYMIRCIPRDGRSTNAVETHFVMAPRVLLNKHWLVIDLAGQQDSVSGLRT